MLSLSPLHNHQCLSLFFFLFALSRSRRLVESTKRICLLVILDLISLRSLKMIFGVVSKTGSKLFTVSLFFSSQHLGSLIESSLEVWFNQSNNEKRTSIIQCSCVDVTSRTWSLCLQYQPVVHGFISDTINVAEESCRLIFSFNLVKKKKESLFSFILNL